MLRLDPGSPLRYGRDDKTLEFRKRSIIQIKAELAELHEELKIPKPNQEHQMEIENLVERLSKDLKNLEKTLEDMVIPATQEMPGVYEEVIAPSQTMSY